MTSCTCPTYHFPHRKGGGACLYNPASEELRCTECGKVCELAYWPATTEDGHRYPEAFVSKCCEAVVMCKGKPYTPTDEPMLYTDR